MVVIMLDRNSLVDLHEQLSNLLREQIRTGELSGRIPSIKHLAQQYEVSTKTVERALDTLKDEDLIAARVGRGFFVKPR
jgi:DNA-binding GntR family transcriptional regulator